MNDAALELATFSAWLTFCGDLYGWILTPEITGPGFSRFPTIRDTGPEHIGREECAIQAHADIVKAM